MFADTPTTDILTPILGVVSIAISSLGTLIVKHYLDKSAAKKTLSSADVSDFVLRFQIPEMQGVYMRIDSLINDTTVDRFIMLQAENGAIPMKSATAIIERYRDKQQFYAILLYDHIEIDDHYREMLKMCEERGVFEMETATMPNSKLKGFYEDELITFSNCYFLGKLSIGDKSVIFYATAATKQPQKFTDKDERHIERVMEHIKKILKGEMERTLSANKAK